MCPSLRELVLAPLVKRELTLELTERLEPLRLEPAVVGGLAHGASRLLLVAAIAEVTAVGELVDVAEGVFEAAFPELHLAHAGRVDDQAASGQDQQLAVRRRVAPALILGAHLGGALAAPGRAAG